MAKINLEKVILDKIKSEKIEPRSREFFLWKNILFWFLSALFVLFGAVSFASVLYKISGNMKILESVFLNKLHFSDSVIYLVPYFWIILLGIFVYLALVNYKKTKLFYRRSMSMVVLSALSISFVLGSVFFYLGFAQKTEEISVKYLPFYNKYLKVQDLRKKAFVRKMNDLGITKEILADNPELRKKVEDKFDKNVLGKMYLFKKPDVCVEESFKCESDEIFFEDVKGCGCRQVYFDLMSVK